MISENFKLSLQYSSATSIPLLKNHESIFYPYILIITEDDSTTLLEFAFNKTSFSPKATVLYL
jgi:hypothetical protein